MGIAIAAACGRTPVGETVVPANCTWSEWRSAMLRLPIDFEPPTEPLETWGPHRGTMRFLPESGVQNEDHFEVTIQITPEPEEFPFEDAKEYGMLRPPKRRYPVELHLTVRDKLYSADTSANIGDQTPCTARFELPADFLADLMPQNPDTQWLIFFISIEDGGWRGELVRHTSPDPMKPDSNQPIDFVIAVVTWTRSLASTN